MNCSVQRESQWTKKSSTINQCSEMFNQLSVTNFIPTPDNCYNFECSARSELPKLKKAACKLIQQQFTEKSVNKAKQTPFQGELLVLLTEEESDISWKSLIFSVPKGVMAWAVRACTNSLATPDNLARWGRLVEPKCSMVGCESKATLGHILSNCQKMVIQGRYTYRHDSCLNHLYKTLIENKPQNIDIYADLDDCKTRLMVAPFHQTSP